MGTESTDEKLKKALENVLQEFDIELAPEKDPQESFEDYSEVIHKTQNTLDDLNEKGQQILLKTGMTREQLDVYASNPNNFTQDQWQALEKLRTATEEFKRQMTATAGKDRIAIERNRKKPQHRFGKKKNWIPL